MAKTPQQLEANRIYMKGYRLRKRDYYIAKSKEYRASMTSEEVWENNLRKYGITKEGYFKIYELQNGCCAICKTHQSCLKKRMCVDHCHTTKEVRGLLCHNCNRGLGLLGDTKQSIEKALDYLNG